MKLKLWSAAFLGAGIFAFALLISNGCSNSSSTSDSGGSTVVVSNTCYRSPSDLNTYKTASCVLTKSMTGSPPSWIDNNFDCVQVDSSGGTHAFTTKVAPNYKSKYWGNGHANFENSMPSGTSANPNTISVSNTYTVNIPKSPTVASSPTASGYDLVGVAANGVAIFNNQAAPGDSLATELATMDYGNGHPTQNGVYHYHIEPCYLSNNDGNLVGVMRDGFPIFGRKEPDTLADPVYVDSCTPGTATSVTNCRPFPTQVPNFHCHTVSGGYPDCHYHVITTDPFIIEYYAGTPGSMTP